MNINIMYYIYLVPVILLSMSFHELSHGYVAYKLGDPTAKNMGRLSLNPLRHLDVLGTIVLFISALSGRFMIGWAKPVPFNPLFFRDRKKGSMLVGLAGPLSNVLLALVFSVPMAVIGVKYGANTNEIFSIWNFYFIDQLIPNGILFNICRIFYVMNISLAVFNIIPVPPLDGSKILSGILPERQYFKLMQYENYIGVIFLVILLVNRNALGTILRPLYWVVETAIQFIVKPILGIL